MGEKNTRKLCQKSKGSSNTNFLMIVRHGLCFFPHYGIHFLSRPDKVVKVMEMDFVN